MTAQDPEQQLWKNWYFEGEFLCSPNGDRFTPQCIMACIFQRQLDEVRQLLTDWPRSVQ